MADSSGRRISLDPIFEPFDLLDTELPIEPHGINGFHSASSSDEDITLFGGLGCQSIGPDAIAGSNGAEPSAESSGDAHTEPDGSAPHAEPNGTVSNATASSGTASNGTASNGAASNGSAINGDLFATHSTHESAAALPDISGTETTGAAASEADFEVIDLGHDSQAEVESPPVEEMPVLDEQAVGVDDAAVADALESPADELADPHAELPEAVALDAPAAQSARDAHPAAGSMFVPYLVTEIRELRGRTQRRRSWWRRLFG